MDVRFIDGIDPEYELLDVVGRRSGSGITKERRIRDGKIVVCKSIDCSSNPGLMSCIIRKLSLLPATPALTDDLSDEEDEDENEGQNTQQDYIARFSEDCSVCERTSTLRLYMDFYAGGDVQTVIDGLGEQNETVCPITAVTWAMQIASAINSYHGQGITYRELNPSKVLLSSEFPWNALCWDISNRDSLTTQQKQILAQDRDIIKRRYLTESTCFMKDVCVKELIDSLEPSHSGVASTSLIESSNPGSTIPSKQDASSFQSDIFNLGRLLYTICTGNHPFPNNDFTSTYPPISTAYPSKFTQTIYECLSLDPKMRPTSTALSTSLALTYYKEVELFVELIDDIPNPPSPEDERKAFNRSEQTPEDSKGEEKPLYLFHGRKGSVDMVEDVYLKRWLMFEFT